jgi:hypothetical protein
MLGGCECCESTPELQWAFDTSIGPSPCPKECHELMGLWKNGGVSGWDKSICGGGGSEFIVSNSDPSQDLKITIRTRPNMTLSFKGFTLCGETFPPETKVTIIEFIIPAGCNGSIDISDKFTAFYDCTCNDPNSTSRCRGGTVTEVVTFEHSPFG